MDNIIDNIQPQPSDLRSAEERELTYKIRDLNRNFRRACSQLILINNLLDDTTVRYNRAVRDNLRTFKYVLRLRLCTLEGVRNAFYEYAYTRADILESLQTDLFNNYGVAWNARLAEESDDQQSDEEDREPLEYEPEDTDNISA